MVRLCCDVVATFKEKRPGMQRIKGGVLVVENYFIVRYECFTI